MSRERESAMTEHTLNIRAGLPLLSSNYGMVMDEYDYIDLAINNLRDIRHFGSTEYISIMRVDAKGAIILPCNADSIDAVVTRHMAHKVFETRVEMDFPNSEESDDYLLRSRITQGLRPDVNMNSRYAQVTSENYLVNGDHPHMRRHNGFPGLTRHREEEGYIPYTLENGVINVSEEYAGLSIGIAFTGISVDIEGYPLITRKQANALAAIAAKSLALKQAMRGNRNMAALLESLSGDAGRLKQAASIAEDISDNELDEVLDVMNSFNRKSVNRPTKYSR